MTLQNQANVANSGISSAPRTPSAIYKPRGRTLKVKVAMIVMIMNYDFARDDNDDNDEDVEDADDDDDDDDDDHDDDDDDDDN